MAEKKLMRQTGSNTEGRVSIRRANSADGEGKTPFENFEGLTAKLLQVPKEEARGQVRKRS